MNNKIRIEAFDWAVSVPIVGSKNSIEKARRVLVYWLVQRGNASSGNVHAIEGPSQISRDLSMPIASVNRAVKRLEKQGIICPACYGMRRINVGKLI